MLHLNVFLVSSSQTGNILSKKLKVWWCHFCSDVVLCQRFLKNKGAGWEKISKILK